MSDLVSKWRSKRLKMAFINYYPIAGSNGSWQEWSECVSSAHVNHVFRRRSRHILDTTSLSRRQLNNFHCLFTTEVQINQHISRTLMFFVKLFASYFSVLFLREKAYHQVKQMWMSLQTNEILVFKIYTITIYIIISQRFTFRDYSPTKRVKAGSAF